MGLLFIKVLLDYLYRYEGDKSRSLRTKLKYLFLMPGFTFTFFLRHSSMSNNLITRYFWLFFFYLIRLITHIQIPVRTKIGNGLYIFLHFGPIIVNPEAIIGKNFCISSGCLVGDDRGKRAGSPVIGNNVYMGANSIIVGNVHIGDHVFLAPGAFVNFDVPNNSIVLGNPGKIIQRKESPPDKHIIYQV